LANEAWLEKMESLDPLRLGPWQLFAGGRR